MHSVIIRYSELGLKSNFVRKMFEKKLVENLKKHFHKEGAVFEKILRFHSRIVILTRNPRKIMKISLNTFGVKNVSISKRISNDLEVIKKESANLLKKRKFKTFRITTQRIYKKYPYTSMQVNKEVGAYILKKINKARVRLENPNINIGVEILEKDAFLFFEKKKGVGGLPVGVEGRVLCLIQNNRQASLKDSIISALLLMRRGCSIDVVSLNKKYKIDVLKKFSPEKINYFVSAKSKLNDLVKEYDAFVTGEKINNLKEWHKIDDIIEAIVLRPLCVVPRSYFEKIFKI